MAIIKITSSIILLIVQIIAITSNSLATMYNIAPIFVVAFILSFIINVVGLLQTFFASNFWIIAIEVILLAVIFYFKIWG